MVNNTVFVTVYWELGAMKRKKYMFILMFSVTTTSHVV